MADDKQRVLVADTDVDAYRTIERLLVGLSLRVTSVETGSAALTAAAAEDFALILLAVDLPDPNGFEVLYRLRERYGVRRPVALMAAARDGTARDEVAALLLGADDFLGKPIIGDGFVARIRRLVVTGRRDGSAGDAQAVARVRLTAREQEVLEMLSHGVRRAEIAERLCITGKTTATHIERILAKLGAHSQAQAVAFALREGLVAAQGSRDDAATAALSRSR